MNDICRMGYFLLVVSYLLHTTACTSNTGNSPATIRNDSMHTASVELMAKLIGLSGRKAHKGITIATALVNRSFKKIILSELVLFTGTCICSWCKQKLATMQGCNKNVPGLYHLGYNEMERRTIHVLFDSTYVPVHKQKSESDFTWYKPGNYLSVSIKCSRFSKTHQTWSGAMQLNYKPYRHIFILILRYEKNYPSPSFMLLNNSNICRACHQCQQGFSFL